MNSRFLRLIQFSVIAMDLVCLNVLVITLQLSMHRIGKGYSMNYALFWLWLNISWAAVSAFKNLYHLNNIISFERFSRHTLVVFAYWLVVVFLYLYFGHQYELSRIYIATILTSQFFIVFVNRLLYLLIRHYFKTRHLLVSRVMVVGYNNASKKLVSYLEEDGMNKEIIGYCEDNENISELSHYPIMASVEDALEVSQRHGVNEIYSTIAPEQNSGIYRLMEQAEQACIRFRIIPDLHYFLNRSFHVNYLKDIPILSVRNPSLDDAGNRIRKRIFDLAFSLLVIVFLMSWLVPLLGLLIKLESRGPVFFKQLRNGKNNQPFWCYKFRSMKQNKESDNKQATKDDPRLTRIGRFIRKTNIDELPQFFNVLRGDMSVVGPRPHMIRHTEDYSQVINDFMVRQFLKPGITGWAQINGYRGETKSLSQMKQRVEHDIWYMESWGLWLDVRIILLTVLLTVKGDKTAF